MKEQFTDGFVFIELGPQATDPNVKLAQLYHLLTGENLKHSGINHAEHEIKQLTNDYYCNLLIIIDDVWHVEDAEPLVKAFSNCKTVLTSIMNDIDKYIPSIQSVGIGPMTENEALSLLTTGVINRSQLLLEDVNILIELAQDVHLWPLLLSLIRGQLFHYIKHYHLPYHRAILNVQAKLYDKGLTAFDKNNIEGINKGRKLAVEACIEMTLELLTKSLSDKIKIFVLYNGIGLSLQTAVLHNLWNISKQEAQDVVDALWAYGLAKVINSAASLNFYSQSHLEIHAVISQYIMECMDSNEMETLSPFGRKLNTSSEIWSGLELLCRESCRMPDISSLTAKEFLKYKLIGIENIDLLQRIRNVNMCSVSDPHNIIRILQKMHKLLTSSPSILNLIVEELSSLNTECKRASKNAHMLCRKLNQGVQRILYEKEYDKLIPTVQKFMRIYPICNIAEKAIIIVNKILPYCEGELLDILNGGCECLYLMTLDYHQITTATIPCIKLHIKHIKQITSALTNGSPDIERMYHYFVSDKYQEDHDLLVVDHLIKVQNVAPKYVAT